MTDESVADYLRRIGREGGKKGGKRRMASLTPRQRTNLGRKAAMARWGVPAECLFCAQEARAHDLRDGFDGQRIACPHCEVQYALTATAGASKAAAAARRNPEPVLEWLRRAQKREEWPLVTETDLKR